MTTNTKHTPGPWQRRSIPGHLFEIKNTQGEIVLRIRGGMMPTLEDSQLLEAAPELVEMLRESIRSAELIAIVINAAHPDEAAALRTMALRNRALLARIDGTGEEK